MTRCLRLMLHLGRVPQAAAGSVHTYGAQALPGHRFFFSSLSPFCFFSGFCFFLWLAVPWMSEQRTPPCTTATLLSRPLSCSFLPGLPTTCCCECSRRPWGMCLSLLPSGAFSHISPPPRASIGLELAFTQTLWQKTRRRERLS